VGNTVASTVTDDEGRYLFSGLCEGTYRVRFELPDLVGLVNEAWTTTGAGDVAADSNADENGLTDLIVVTDGTEDLSWDAGIIADDVSPTTVTTMPEATTTTVPQPTTSAPIVTTTTVPPVTASTLPFTGFELQTTALIGLLVLAGGGLLMIALGRESEVADNDSLGTW
jgi:hypothetical protein